MFLNIVRESLSLGLTDKSMGIMLHSLFRNLKKAIKFFNLCLNKKWMRNTHCPINYGITFRITQRNIKPKEMALVSD